MNAITQKKLKPFTIEWLRVQRGMEDPFVQCVDSRPNSSTLTPNRDIDYILTNGIKIPSIPTLHPNNPAHSDHLGIVFDVDLSSYFSSSYSDIASPSHCLLTSGNQKSFDTYTS
jgi:hypothetical protein